MIEHRYIYKILLNCNLNMDAVLENRAENFMHDYLRDFDDENPELDQIGIKRKKFQESS